MAKQTAAQKANKAIESILKKHNCVLLPCVDFTEGNNPIPVSNVLKGTVGVQIIEKNG